MPLHDSGKTSLIIPHPRFRGHVVGLDDLLAFPWGIHNKHTEHVPPPTSPKMATWRPWTIGVSALLALLVSLLLLLADGLAGVLNNLGGPPSARTWLGVAAVGHGVLALASAVLFGVGRWKPAWRNAAVLAAWAIIPVGVGWFVLCGRLAAG
jgi:hypothetical protein